jgi:hypothetical protein
VRKQHLAAGTSGPPCSGLRGRRRIIEAGVASAVLAGALLALAGAPAEAGKLKGVRCPTRGQGPWRPAASLAGEAFPGGGSPDARKRGTPVTPGTPVGGHRPGAGREDGVCSSGAKRSERRRRRPHASVRGGALPAPASDALRRGGARLTMAIAGVFTLPGLVQLPGRAADVPGRGPGEEAAAVRFHLRTAASRLDRSGASARPTFML